MIPYSRSKLSDLYTLSQSKLLENHTLHSGIYSPYMAVPPPPPGTNCTVAFSYSKDCDCWQQLSSFDATNGTTKLVDRILKNVNVAPIFSEKCNTTFSCCCCCCFFFLLLIYFAYMYVSPFVLSFLAHSLSKGNLQQLQFRESKERQQVNRSPTNT